MKQQPTACNVIRVPTPAVELFKLCSYMLAFIAVAMTPYYGICKFFAFILKDEPGSVINIMSAPSVLLGLFIGIPSICTAIIIVRYVVVSKGRSTDPYRFSTRHFRIGRLPSDFDTAKLLEKLERIGCSFSENKITETTLEVKGIIKSVTTAELPAHLVRSKMLTLTAVKHPDHFCITVCLEPTDWWISGDITMTTATTLDGLVKSIGLEQVSP